jgi:hypothetical protein
MNDNLAIRFSEYIDKVFGFGSMVGELRDRRKEPQIPTKAVFLSGFFPLAFRCRSLNNAEGLLRIPGRIDPLVGARKPSADRVGDVFALIPPEQVRRVLTSCVHKLGRNKVLGSPWTTSWGVVDGHEFFSR